MVWSGDGAAAKEMMFGVGGVKENEKGKGRRRNGRVSRK